MVTAEMLVVRTSPARAVVAAEVHARVQAVDPGVQVTRVSPFRELLQAPLARPRFNALLIGVFGAAALLLAMVGLYAVVAAYVRQRYTEIGVRLALGATAADERGLVVGEGLPPARAGTPLWLCP